MINALKQSTDTGTNTSATNANLLNVLATGTLPLSNSLVNMLTVCSSVSSRIQEQDYASAIAEYYRRQTSQQGEQQSFMQIQGMNLFQYLR